MARQIKPEPFTTQLSFKPMDGIGGGFRTEWLTGHGDSIKFGLDSGAGVGNPLLTFWIEQGNGKRQYYTADVQELVKSAIAKIVKGA